MPFAPGARFEREARALAALNHFNVCQIYDVVPDYLVMEYGRNVTKMMRLKSCSPGERPAYRGPTLHPAEARQTCEPVTSSFRSA